MSLLPDPLSDALVAKLEGEVVNAILSSQLSSWITFWWNAGKKSLFGLGSAFQAMAASQYLSLRQLEKKNFLTLTVPTDMLESAVISQFQTEEKEK